MGNNEVVNVGIGFATGRKNFKNVLATYMYHLDESKMLKNSNIISLAFINLNC